MRRIFVSRSSLEKPRPLDRFVRTSSPSSISIFNPRPTNSEANAVASVDLPAPESPVNQTVNPLLSVIEHVLLTLVFLTIRLPLPVPRHDFDKLRSALAPLPDAKTP